MLKKLRSIALSQQGLCKKTPFGSGVAATEKALQHLGYIQIDTLHVVERAHHHTLWTRIPSYNPSHLSQLVAKGIAFEYWSHAASYLPTRDYRFALPMMNSIRRGESRYFNADKKLMNDILNRIRNEGPLKARDFASKKSANGSWWNWKPSKHALETLFMRGDLMTRARQGMEKVYDLRQHVFPDSDNAKEPSIDEYAEYLVDTSLRAHGFSTTKQILHLKNDEQLKQSVKRIIRDKIDSGTITEVKTDNMPTWLVLSHLLDQPPTINKHLVRILSPFDNSIIHRDRLQHLFGFDYRLECYLPQAKRRFGYFCLPILYANNFAGLADCKANREQQRLDVIQLHVDKTYVDERFAAKLAEELLRFSHFNNCNSIKIVNCTPRTFGHLLKSALASKKTASARITQANTKQ